MSESVSDRPKIILAALFMTSLITAQVIAVKLLAIPFPDSLPIVGASVLVPAGVLAYAVTFFASDCYAELYGRRSAQFMVNVGFGMNFVLLALLWLAIAAPGSNDGVDPAIFEGVLGLSTNIVIGSLIAYIVSQNWDVYSFHLIRDFTEGRHLWLRNLASTGTSQLIDTTIFVAFAFFAVPSLLGIGQALPVAVLLQLIIGQYIVKLLIALLDTPFVYAFVGLVRPEGPSSHENSPAD